MNSEQGSIKTIENRVKDKDDKNDKKADQGGADDAKTVSAPSSTRMTVVPAVSQSQAAGQQVRRMQDVAYEAVKETLRAVVRCSDAFPPLKSAGQAILEMVERYDAVKEIPKELSQLNDKLCLLVDILEGGRRDMSDDRLGGLARTFEEKAKIIAKKLNRSMPSRIIETTEDRAFIAREVSSIMFAIEIAMMDVTLGIRKDVSQLQETVTELNERDLLAKLKYAEGAGFNHEDRQGCTEGTRIMLLADLLAWANDPANEHVFWLNGMAGTGKTTVTETFCKLLSRQGLLGSSFFCSRKKLDRRDVKLIIPALAKGLAHTYPEFRTELLKVLKDDLDFTGLGREDQYLKLILQPAEKAFANSSRAIVLIVDALDECEDAHAAEMFLRTVLLRKPTCSLRLLVTSRPEPKISEGFHSGAHASLRLQEIEAQLVKADIAVFLSNKLKEIRKLYTVYASSWPPAEVNAILDHAGTLFIYAATAVKYISYHHGNPVDRLTKFAKVGSSVKAVHDIDEVYAYILAEAFNDNLEEEERDTIKDCLSMVVCAFEPMSINTYSVLLGIRADQVESAFSSLHSVVQVPESNFGVTTLYHASFSDYLLSNTRSDSKPWLVNLAIGHSNLSSLSLKVMMSKLHFNIAQASTSYKSNLDQSLEVASYWDYIAIYWQPHIVYHMQPLERLDSALVQIITQFLEEKYLYWLEVLSVLNKVQVAPTALYTLAKRVAPGSNLANLCSEFAGFVSTYLVPIQTSVPHIYLSAFPWISSKCQMKSLYSSKFSHLPLITDLSKTEEQASLLLQLTGHQGKVTSVAFASNSTFLVSGSKDKTARVWNAETGEEIFKPFYGHTGPITSVAISPDCQFIATASRDGTMRVWNSKTGKEAWEPLQHDTLRGVTSVVFSSNNKFLLSSSLDTICLWDAKEEGKLLRTFQGTPYHKISVALSSDCNVIAASSFTSPILFWDISTGNQIDKPLITTSGYVALAFSPINAKLLVTSSYSLLSIWNIQSGKNELALRGHEGEVTSAAYSQDGKYIVSADVHHTVRLWNALTGKEICRPLQGHTDKVTSVAFSGNGKYIASVSWDKTVRVWDIESKEVFKPIQGHSGSVRSVVFSHGDEYILSASNDWTICIWDVKTGKQKMKPLVGHTSMVTSIAVSLDNNYIVSGSDDKTVRVWDFNTGTEIMEPIQGHTGQISSVSINTSRDLIASGSFDASVRLWDFQTGEFKAKLLGNDTGTVSSISFSCNEQYIAAGSHSGKISIWNLSTMNLECTILPPNSEPEEPLFSVAFSPTGTFIASGSQDRDVCIYDYKTGNLVLGPLKGNSGFPGKVVYSPNGRYLASVSGETIYLWDAQTGQQILGPFYGHTEYIMSIHFSGDSKYLVSGGSNIVRIWNLEQQKASDQEPLKFLHNYPIGTFIFKKDGWVLTAENELFMWVPPSIMYALYTPQTNCIFGEEGVTIDLSAFAHGTSWTAIHM